MEGNSQRGGIGCFGVILLILVTLKLLGVAPVASWSWWLVLTPVWFVIACIVAFVALAVIISAARTR